MTLGLTTKGSISEDALEITSDSFGARYVSFRRFGQFDDALSQTNLGMVVWPGGTMAEKNPERFGFEHDGLYNSAELGNKPGIDEMMEYCVMSSSNNVILAT